MSDEDITSVRARRLIVSSGVGVLQRVAQVAFTLVCYPFVTRYLGVEQFGVWGAATSLVWIAWMLDLGVGNALISLVPRSLSGRTQTTPGELVGAALAFATGLAGLILAAGAVIGSAGHWRAGAPFVIAGVALAANIPVGLSSRLWLSLQKGYVGSAWELAQTVFTGCLLIGGVFARWPTWAMVGCVFGAMLAVNAMSFAHLLISHREMRPRASISSPAMRDLLSQSGPMLGIAVAMSAGWALDNTLALAWLGAAAAAQMAIAIRLCTTAQGVITVVAQSFWPAFAGAAHDRAWVEKTLLRGVAALGGLSFLGAIVLALVGGPLLQLWLGRAFGLSQPTLWAVGAWVTAFAVIQVPAYLLMAVSRLKALLLALVISAAVGLALKAVAAPTFGPAGMLWVTTALNLAVVLPTVLLATRAWFRSPAHALSAS